MNTNTEAPAISIRAFNVTDGLVVRFPDIASTNAILRHAILDSLWGGQLEAIATDDAPALVGEWVVQSVERDADMERVYMEVCFHTDDPAANDAVCGVLAVLVLDYCETVQVIGACVNITDRYDVDFGFGSDS